MLAASYARAAIDPRDPALADLAWRPEFVGVESLDVTLTSPRPLRVHALRIDLTADGVSVCVDRGNGDRPEETDSAKTSTFLVQRGCQAAVNAAPFWPVHATEGQPQNVTGLVVSDGELVSPVDQANPRAALVIGDDGRAAVRRPPIDLSGVRHAVGGFGVIVRDGAVVRPASETYRLIRTLHPRSAVGVADRGRRLLLVAVDGRQPGYSEGVGLGELASLLVALGAADALNLDGGGTTTLVVSDRHGGFRLLNRPIHTGKPGTERPSGSHLGVRAKGLGP